ncbi:hypothetical protein [Serratia sp. UGAL515B_01]|uniref:hypothetical protein n=1 Tax=Serratia sp. UGAL515B_01 TaxID=2986763 RepID=UPI00295554D5|nr:hypothetical protein [Serratia sp. UGAL515B_01]WON78435.1 hypothetical protein OK023_07295 [Serratia sp. UGAL515B_01]
MRKRISEKEYKELDDATEKQALDSVLCYSAHKKRPLTPVLKIGKNIPLGFNPSFERGLQQLGMLKNTYIPCSRPGSLYRASLRSMVG